MNDIRHLELNWRGYPVTLLSDGVARLLGPSPQTELLVALASAQDTAEPDEPSGWIFATEVGGEEVWVERFGGVRDFTTSRHEGGQWSVYLPEER